MNKDIDFGVIFEEIAVRLKMADSKKDAIAWRDAWMFLQGVNLVMQQVDNDLFKDFEALSNGVRQEQDKLLQIPMPRTAKPPKKRKPA